MSYTSYPFILKYTYIYTFIKPKTWLEEMLAEQLSNYIMEARLSVSIEEMLMSGYVD